LFRFCCARLRECAFAQVGVGNHEVDTHENEFHSARGNDSGGECGVTTFKRFPQFTSLSDMWHVVLPPPLNAWGV
jgi:hypothetical protein